MWISHFQKPVLSAVVFFGTILALSVGYAAYSSISSSEYAAGQTLSSTLFGKVVGNLEDLNARTNGISNVDGKIGIGTTSPSEKLDVSGNIKALGTVLMGYERVSVDCSNTTSCVATCPTGKKVLGGGCVRINGGANNLQDAMPSYDTTFNCNWATAPITSRAYAICARIGN